MTKNLSHRRLALLMIAVIGLFSFSFPALAQSSDTWAKGCSSDGTLSGIFCSLSTEFRFIPKTLAFLSYASGVALFFTALLSLKSYSDDPSQTPFRGIVMKFILGAFLISLPLAMQVVVGSLTGHSMDSNAFVTKMKRPCLARGSALDNQLQNTACQ